MLVNSESNTFGCFFIASASDAPLSTSPRVARMTSAKFLSSSCVPRISRHCTRGRPASIMTENCRTKTARFFGLTDFPLRAFVFALAGLICVTRTCSRRKPATTASIVSATRSPVIVSPARVRPLNAKVGIVHLTTYRLTYRPIAGRGGAPPLPSPAPATTPTPRLIISCSSSLFEEAFRAVSRLIDFFM